MHVPLTHPLQPSSPIDLVGLPALHAALWHRHDTVMPAIELLHLHEDRWTYIDPSEMDAGEVALLERLVTELGNGVLLG